MNLIADFDGVILFLNPMKLFVRGGETLALIFPSVNNISMLSTAVHIFVLGVPFSSICPCSLFSKL